MFRKLLLTSSITLKSKNETIYDIAARNEKEAQEASRKEQYAAKNLDIAKKIEDICRSASPDKVSPELEEAFGKTRTAEKVFEAAVNESKKSSEKATLYRDVLNIVDKSQQCLKKPSSNARYDCLKPFYAALEKRTGEMTNCIRDNCTTYYSDKNAEEAYKLATTRFSQLFSQHNFENCMKGMPPYNVDADKEGGREKMCKLLNGL